MIESLQNEKIKYLSRLITDNRFRKKNGLFTVEGKQENERAQKFGYEPVEYYICPEIFGEDSPAGRVHDISVQVYEKIAYRSSVEGIIGIYKVKDHTLKNFFPKEKSSVIVVEGVEKPGNLGAILRSCEAFGIDALIVTDPLTDFYNPNVIRSSVGCLFGMNIFQSGNDELYQFLKENNYQIITTLMDERAEIIYQKDLTAKSAVLFGTEHSGLSEFWLTKGDNALIPMSGTIDSLNLSNAVAITCYEILRQRSN